MNPSDAPLPPRAVGLIVTRAASALGTSLTSFGLDVWIYERTGSFALFAYVALLALVPNLVLAPFSGMVTDRVNKKWLLLFTEVLTLLALGGLSVLHLAGELSMSAIAIGIFVMAVGASLRWMALSATIAALVPRESLVRINGLQQALQGFTTVSGPVLGAAGLHYLGLNGILAVDAVTCVIAMLGLSAVSAQSLSAPRSGRFQFKGFWQEVTFGFRWVGQHAHLVRLMVFFMFFNLGVSVFSVTFTPYVLSSSGSREMLGAALAAQGAGAFAAGMVLTRRRPRWAAESGVLGGALLFGLMMMGWGLGSEHLAIPLLAAMAGALATLIMASSQAIWQAQVPLEIQGKVFAARMMVAFALGPLAILGSVPLAERVIAPLLASGSRWSALWHGGDAALGCMLSLLGASIVAICIVVAARGGLGVRAPNLAAAASSS